MNRPYAKLTITKKGERAARSGHPWVYGEEVTHVEGTYQTGDIVDVYSDKDRYLGTALPMIFPNPRAHRVAQCQRPLR